MNRKHGTTGYSPHEAILVRLPIDDLIRVLDRVHNSIIFHAEPVDRDTMWEIMDENTDRNADPGRKIRCCSSGSVLSTQVISCRPIRWTLCEWDQGLDYWSRRERQYRPSTRCDIVGSHQQDQANQVEVSTASRRMTRRSHSLVGERTRKFFQWGVDRPHIS